MYNNTTPGNVSSHPYHPTTAAVSLQHHPFHHQPIMIPLSPLPPPFSEDEFPRRDERFPQWSYQETRDFIEIRAQLEWNFNASKRNKNLWEMVSARMGEKGYRRTVDQCKAKWKNLVNRYKGQEPSDPENGRQCPFFDELHALFTARANRIEQAQPEPETSSLKGKKRLQIQSNEEFSEEQDQDGEETDSIAKKKSGKEKRQKTGNTKHNENNNNNVVLAGLHEMLTRFMEQQKMIDMQWKESMEKRAHEREVLEREWRETMERLETERMMMERSWREREEQRRVREESRAEERDALLTTLLNRLIHDDNN